MDIDFCFPDENEEEFVSVATSLGIGALCFIYRGIRRGPLKKFSGHYNCFLIEENHNKKVPAADFYIVPHGMNFKQKEKTIFFFDIKKYRGVFFSPAFGLTQVHVKEIYPGIAAIPLALLRDAKKDPHLIEKIRFFGGLCKKYKVGIVSGSFCKKPAGLIAPEGKKSIMRLFDLTAGNII